MICAACALEPLLPTRPSAFFLRKDEKGKEELQKVLGRILEELSGAEDLFFYEGRKGMYCIPLAHILYLQSDLKYVEVRTASGEALPVSDAWYGRAMERLRALKAQKERRELKVKND